MAPPKHNARRERAPKGSSPGTERFPLFATCAPGVEPALHAEMRELRFAKVERQVGGVYFEGTLRDAGRANLHLRTAIRVLLRVARFQAPDEEALYAGVREVPWERWLAPTGTLAAKAHARDSKLFHTAYIAQRTKDAVVDRFRDREGVRPSVDKEAPDLGIHVHLVKDRCSLLLDTTGPSLHKRGRRRYQGRAPLAETLAAAMLHFSGWDRTSPLVDPFCGSGTLLTEAAILAAAVAPGLERGAFAFESWPGGDAGAMEREREQARGAAPPRRMPILRGSDISPDQVSGAAENLEACGLADAVELEVADARAFAPRPGWNAWIVTNPPYGERVGNEAQLEETYASFGARLREGGRGYRLALLGGNRRLTERLDLPGAERIPLENGALPCELLVGELP